MQAGDDQRVRQFAIGGGRTHGGCAAFGPLNNGVLVVLVHATVDDGVVVAQLQFAHLALDIEPAASRKLRR